MENDGVLLARRRSGGGEFWEDILNRILGNSIAPFEKVN